ncbi:MAG: hypothetical protein GF333_00705 [Candidatus Omnitrophica bacterium]|nr:hypothetical protein [Candidatus Omnitrophota bacterium]
MNTYSLFVYGTLQFPEIMRNVTGKTFPARPARLQGYRRYRVRGDQTEDPYPAVVKEKGVVQGLLVSGIDEATLRKIDQYEGGEYTRKWVKVLSENGPRPAWTYVWNHSEPGRLQGEWDSEEFRRCFLE